MFVYKSTLVSYSSDSPVYISEMGYGINNHFRGSPRPGYRFHFVVSGAGVFNNTQIKKGDFFVTSPYLPDCYYPDPEDPWEYFWFILDGIGAKDFLNNSGINTVSGKIRNLDKVTGLYRDFFRTDFQAAATQLYGWGCFCLMLSYISSENVTKSKSIVEQRVQNACRYIEHYYYKSITVKDIADAVQVDERYLYNIFRQKTGMSPKQYLSKIRYRTACFFLETSQLSVGEIASAVGFENLHYFSSFFKSISGVSPTAYKKQHQ